MPETSKRLIQKTKPNQYAGKLVLVGEQRPKKEPANMVGKLHFYAQYTLHDLQVENNQEITRRKVTSAQKWIEEKTDSLKQDEGIAALLDEMSYVHAVGKMDPQEGNVPDHSWIEATEAILTRLEDTAASDDELNETVLFAETAEFKPEEIPRLLNSLGQFISKNRCSTKEKTILSLGAAIRKFAMNMPEDRFDELASWLSPGETEYLDHRVELELVQGISSRLTYFPVSIASVPNQLIETLQEIASQYTSPRSIVQKNYAATAVEAIVALVLLRIFTDATSEAKHLLETVCKLDRDWFSELVVDQLHETAGHVAGHDQSLSDAISQILAVVA